jgi:SM-20-related protein
MHEGLKSRHEISHSPVSEPELHRRLFEISGELATVFDLELTTIHPLKFTRYDVGDFYKVHRDVTDDAGAPDMIRSRKLALTMFLNQQGDEPDEADYCGGSLTFYGLLDDPDWQAVGIPLDSEAGMLVAFRPNVMHEVTPVTHGTRYAITTWLS